MIKVIVKRVDASLLECLQNVVFFCLNQHNNTPTHAAQCAALN